MFYIISSYSKNDKFFVFIKKKKNLVFKALIIQIFQIFFSFCIYKNNC